MGKDAKAGGKGKGKQASGSDEAPPRGKENQERLLMVSGHAPIHVLCEKQGKINGDKVPPAEFAKANDASYCSRVLGGPIREEILDGSQGVRWLVLSKMSPSTHLLASLVHLSNLRADTISSSPKEGRTD
ncbi:hypothetical protein Bca4012_077104 [Brassica carinata]